jgi:glyoxylase-like metal-dependent hydrolase (beta-lactamase superfamily II)
MQILTHEHDDHVGGLAAVTSEFGAFPSPSELSTLIVSAMMFAGALPVYKLSTPRDRAVAPVGALPLHNGQQLDVQGVRLEVLEDV